MSEIPFPWHTVGNADTEALIQARLEAHWATQLIGATADALLDRKHDDSHTNLFWNPDAGHLEGREIQASTQFSGGPIRVALKLDPLALYLGGESLPLANRTLAEAKDWTEQQLALQIDSAVSLQVRDYDMPDHPVAQGARFAGANQGGHSELASWFDNGTEALIAVAQGLDGISEIAVWPHHFDIGGILFLGPTAAAERTPQVGLGLSPGDHHIPEPYFYITPWPTAEGAAMEGLSIGQWVQDGFSGTVLGRGELAAAGGAVQQGQAVDAFFKDAIPKALLMVRSVVERAAE